MSRIPQLLPAQFRSSPFLYVDETTDRGQKLAIHEYPNRDDRFAEPLGKIPPIIKMTGEVHGDDYIIKRLNFERDLEIPGLGKLQHPIYGTIEVQAGPFTVLSNQKEIGKFTFNLIFYNSKSEITPRVLPATSTTISFIADESRNFLGVAFEDIYEDPNDSFTLDESTTSVLDVLDSVQDSINSVVGPIESAISEARSNLNSFRNKVKTIVQTANGLKTAMLDMYNDVVALSNDPAALSRAWENLLTFNTSLTGPTNTVQRANSESNKSITKEQNEIIGLIGLFESVASTDFSTEDDLNSAIDTVNDAYKKHFENNVTGDDNITSLANNPDLRDSVSNLKVQTRLSLNSQLKNIWRVSDIDPGKSSMSLTAYRYYGSIDNVDDIINLNPDTSVLHIKNTIKAITQ